jgi:hypothetical protein
MAGYFGRGRPITGINTYTKTQSDDRFRDSISGDMLPDSDDIRDLGSSSKAWAEAYVNNLTVAGNAIATDGSMSNRNKIINGNFDFWQRGTSGSSGYVADRWITVRNGSTAAISRQSFTLGQTDVPGEPDYYHRTVVTSSAGANNYVITYQPIESVKTLAGQTATLSFWAKADASKNMAVEFSQYFGTGGSPSAQVTAIDVTTIALTTSWQKFTVTANISSISSKTLGTNNNDYLGVFFWFDADSNFDSRTNTLGQQSGTFDIARVQLEAGDVATPFEERPIGTELALCQRYYEKSYRQSVTPGASGQGNSGVVLYIGTGNSVSNGDKLPMVTFMTVKRATPTILIWSPAGTSNRLANMAGSDLAAGSATPNVSSDKNFFAYQNSGVTVSGTSGCVEFHYTASAEL